MSFFKIIPLENSCFSYQDVLDLIHSAFQQWKELGIESSLLNLTVDQFKERTDGSAVFLAIDNSGTLIGTTTCSVLLNNHGNPYAYNKYSAVKNQMKESGIGSELLLKEKQFALESGCRYIISDTSVFAPWSIKWHKKNGFRVIGLKSFSNNSYYSYVFRCQLKKTSIWNNLLFTQTVFICSWVKTRVIKRADGSLTFLGRMIVEVLNCLRNQ